MKTLAGAVALLFQISLIANAQSAVGEGPYGVTASFIDPYASIEGEFEVRLMKDDGQVMESLRARTQERFNFRVGELGVYFIEADVPGYKNVRQRVELSSVWRAVNTQVMLEAQEEIVISDTADLTGEKDIVHAPDTAQPAAVLKDLQEAEQRLRSGNIDGAQTLLESLVLEAPDFYDAHKTLGIAYDQLHRYRDAEREFQIAQKLRPQSPEPLIYLGGVYLEQSAGAVDSNESRAAEALTKAGEVLEKAIALNPQAAFGRYLYGVMYFKQGRFDEAEIHLAKALELEPRLGDAHLALANISIRLQNWPEALTHLDAYLKDSPHSPNRDAVMEVKSRLERMATGG